MKKYAFYNSPYGLIKIGYEDKSVICIKRVDVKDCENEPDEFTDNVFNELCEYFDGKRKAFDFEIKLCGTPFQKQVWSALLTIPYGETRSYKDIAEMINNPKAMRAVGMACNKNPVWIAVPCHRVIGASGSLTGYEGGLDMKKRLLEGEKRG